jgi:hypothetical protein
MNFYSINKVISEQIELDATDLRLLDLLQRDASISNQALAERVHVSPPTCLRRVKRLRDAGLIERDIAILNDDKLAPILGHGLSAIVEITLDRQGADTWKPLKPAWRPMRPCSSVTACRRGRTLCWWCLRMTCRATWRWRSACLPATPMCGM